MIKSENIGGALSFIGSLLPLAAGDAESIAASALFAAAEIVMMRAGNTTRGYALSAAGFAAGDMLLAFSPGVESGSVLQAALLAMGAVLALGALRYPLERLGARKMADRLQPAVGIACLALRVPGLVAAYADANMLMLAAIAFWAASDIFCGRLQDHAKWLYGRFKAA